MNSDFSEIKDYACLKTSLNAVSAEIREENRKLTSWKHILLHLVRRMRAKL